MTIKAKHGTLKQELTDWLDEDVMHYVIRRLEHDGWSYAQLVKDLEQSGYAVKAATLSYWVNKERKRTL